MHLNWLKSFHQHHKDVTLASSFRFNLLLELSITRQKIISLCKYLCLCYLLITGSNSTAFATESRKVLVLHSYHHGLEWTDQISRGIQSVFSPLKKYYDVHFDYLDTKRNPQPEYIDALVEFISTKHSKSRYDAVIVADNNALKLVNDGKISFLGSPPIIFCGINHYTEDMSSNIEQIAGVLETADHRSNFELIKKIHPGRKNITIILDQTPTGNAVYTELQELIADYEEDQRFEFIRDFTFEGLPEQLKHLDSRDVIYLLTFNRDQNNRFISYTDGIALLNNSVRIPIYGAWEFYLGKGIVGGKLVSGFLQGQEAAELTLQILQNNQPALNKIVQGSPTQYIFDYTYLKKFNIKRSALPSDSEILNSPPSYYETNKKLLLTLTTVFFILALLLLWKTSRQQALLKIKQAQATELEEKVYERTVELEVVNRELQRLSNIDGLTEIYNRRYFDEKLAAEIKRLQRSSSPLSLLMCDIDHFKNYNDSYGHLAGDKCIQSVVESIRLCCHRIADIPARFGGEEFAVILPETPSQGAMVIAQRILDELEAKQIPHQSSLVKEIVSLSIGIVTLIPTAETRSSEVINLADEALYESKHKGRDCISLRNQETGAV